MQLFAIEKTLEDVPDRGFDQPAPLQLSRNLGRYAGRVVDLGRLFSEGSVDAVLIVDVADILEVEEEVLLVSYGFEESLIEEKLRYSSFFIGF